MFVVFFVFFSRNVVHTFFKQQNLIIIFVAKVKITVCSKSGRHNLILCCVSFFLFY